MKTSQKLNFFVLAITIFLVTPSFAQTSIQYYRPDGQLGLNVFETSKTDTVVYEGLKVKIGGDFAMQFQSINQSNDADNLTELGSNLNLPTANLNLDVQLEDGLRIHLRTYLSARHHEESWVKGGYMQMDNLNFISDGFLSGLMEIAAIRVGMDEFNYGDAHFRRTDNARATYNPFVGNYIMDAFSTEAFFEVNLQKNGLIGVLGFTNGKLNQNVTVNDNSDNKVSFFGKLGYDNQINDDLRLRLTGSWYINKGTTTGTWLYGGDRAGARYYHVTDYMYDDGTGNIVTASSDFGGRFNARFTKLTAIQINPFVKYKGLEFFGIYEIASGSATGEGSMTQVAGEAIYRLGQNDQFYLGGRYNMVKGNTIDGAPDLEIKRFNIGGGWFLTKNVITKLEYVNQTYGGEGYEGNTQFDGFEFKGFVIEAAISF
ncbi:hypothetical protein SAMN04488029_3110 [Reichenbachiella faecimaris]|uniref:Phosphate-selective porin O and P n=1 Tax=Reichenbachiella faecimaris TaxID=692418 RepID=A0A1W2GJN0_REIFA|nr:hypothetical protein [Reichenbachiella faecimaris]SMD36865.1 hypothetical protein SAMN04488029_3110 [Reichenbachiella faecimaris]